jgi:DNA-binding NarL/FixJ family response regulator
LVIRVVLAEDDYLVREGIQRLLEPVEDVEVVASCGDVGSLLAAIEASTPDVVLTDIRMPPTSTDEGIRVANELRDSHPEVGVVVLSQFVDSEYPLALFDRGADRRAYLLKERVRDTEGLVHAIREVAGGGSVIDSKVVEELVLARSRLIRTPLENLTPRELQVLGEMAQGKSNAAIAGEVFMTAGSVEKVIHSIFLKLGLTWTPSVNRRVKAVLVYLSEEGVSSVSSRAP